MSDTLASLRHKIASAGELESVVRTMKAMAASNIGQYENAVRSLDGYYRTVQLGLTACFRQSRPAPAAWVPGRAEALVGAVVFGSDQGLVGQFNEALVEHAAAALAALPGRKIVWAVGERVRSRLVDRHLVLAKGFNVPGSIGAITPLVGQMLIELETRREAEGMVRILLFHNRPQSGALYEPVGQRLLPLDEAWRRDLAARPWPTDRLPEVMACGEPTVFAFVREYLFVSLFRTCAESLAAENASRLAAMQRAEKNIGELLEALSSDFHRLRQGAIDEELFDVVSGFEALNGP